MWLPFLNKRKLLIFDVNIDETFSALKSKSHMTKKKNGHCNVEKYN